MNDKPKRGFASMTAEQRLQVARKGGAAVPPEKRSFSTNPKLAAQAGRKGGLAVEQEKRAFVNDRDLAVSAGQKGRAAKVAKMKRLVDS